MKTWITVPLFVMLAGVALGCATCSPGSPHGPATIPAGGAQAGGAAAGVTGNMSGPEITGNYALPYLHSQEIQESYADPMFYHAMGHLQRWKARRGQSETARPAGSRQTFEMAGAAQYPPVHFLPPPPTLPVRTRMLEK
jgi:hypothetical protein